MDDLIWPDANQIKCAEWNYKENFSYSMQNKHEKVLLIKYDEWMKRSFVILLFHFIDRN